MINSFIDNSHLNNISQNQKIKWYPPPPPPPPPKKKTKTKNKQTKSSIGRSMLVYTEKELITL